MRKSYACFVVALLIAAAGFAQQLDNAKGSGNGNDQHIPGTSCYSPQQMKSMQGQNPSPLDGNQTLGLTAKYDLCGLNFVTASQRLGKRGSLAGVNQPANFVISGIPACAIIVKAYIWSDMSGTATAFNVTVTNPLAVTNTYPATLIGTAADKCWGYGGTTSYRVDCTSAISGNGTYQIGGYPTNPPTPSKDTDGATLMIIYRDPSQTWQGHIIIHDGAIVGIGTNQSYTITGINACSAGTNTIGFMIVGDLQLNGLQEMVNSTTYAVPWNWWNYNQSAVTNITNGQTTAPCQMIVQPCSLCDCFNIVAAGLYYQTTTCTTCTNSAFTVNMASTPATCSVCNGTATATASGGGPFTYTWTPSGGTNATATGLCAGTYTVTVVSGCNTVTQTVQITSTSAITTTTAQTPILCNGACTGTATVTPSGGTTPYTYSWNTIPIQTTQTATGLCAGSYTVTVTSQNGCTQTVSVTINQPSALGVTMSPPTNVTCNNLCNGSASVTVTGGTTGYTYSWAPSGGTGPNATGLCQGNYTVTVTDANGCTKTASVAITQPSGLTLTSSQTIISCSGACDASATVNASGGVTPYTYAWSPSGGNNATANNLCAGNYTVTVTDNNGCAQTVSYNIPAPTPLGATSVNQINVACNNACTGSATIAASGGTGTYSYGWSPSGGNGATATGLCAGTYTVTVTDAHGCTITQAYTITQPPALTGAATSINPTCSNFCNGTATIAMSGGVSPYSYQWNTNPVQNTQTATGLCGGSFTVTATDFNGCTFTSSVTLVAPPPMTQSNSQVDVTCNSACNGSAVINVSGGTPNYTYNWLPSGGTNNSASGLCAGGYTVTVTDANGCTMTIAYTITQPNVLASSVNSVNPLCISQCTTLNCTTSGGTTPYTYLWNTNQTGNGIQVCPTTTTAYTVTITDVNNCTTTATVQVIVNPPLAVTTTGGTICAGQNTNISASGSGGSGSGYTYTWNTGQTGTPITVSPTATTIYTVTLTDNCGSPAATNTVQVTVNPLPTVLFVGDTLQGCAPLCVNFTNQTANSATCFWTTSAPSTSSNCNYSYCFTNAGSYNVSLTVVDNNGCQSQLTLNNYINVWPNAQASFTMSSQTLSITDPTVCFTNGSLNATAYQWIFGDSANSTSTQTNPCFTYNDTGTYCVTLIAKTNNNCPDTTIVCLYVEPDYAIYVPNAFTPDGDGINDLFFPQGIGIDPNNFEMWIFDRWGNNIWYSQKWGEGWNGHANGGKDIAQIDTYVWKINLKDVNGNKHSLIGHVSLIK